MRTFFFPLLAALLWTQSLVAVDPTSLDAGSNEEAPKKAPAPNLHTLPLEILGNILDHLIAIEGGPLVTKATWEHKNPMALNAKQYEQVRNVALVCHRLFQGVKAQNYLGVRIVKFENFTIDRFLEAGQQPALAPQSAFSLHPHKTLYELDGPSLDTLVAHVKKHNIQQPLPIGSIPSVPAIGSFRPRFPGFKILEQFPYLLGSQSSVGSFFISPAGLSTTQEELDALTRLSQTSFPLRCDLNIVGPGLHTWKTLQQTHAAFRDFAACLILGYTLHPFQLTAFHYLRKALLTCSNVTEVSNMFSLKELDIASCAVSRIQGCPVLKKLILDNLRHLKRLHDLPRLETLTCIRCPLEEVSQTPNLRNFCCENMEKLPKFDCPISVEKISLINIVTPGDLAIFVNLKDLTLRNLGEQLTVVKNFPNLIRLEINECSYVREVSNLPKLETLLIIKSPQLTVLRDLPKIFGLKNL